MIFRISTYVFGAGLLLIGLASWAARTPYGVQLTEPDARADLNAVIVGLHLAVGSAMVVLALLRLHAAAMLVGTLTVTGLAAVRTVEMAVGDAATTRQWVLLAPELLGIAIGVLFLVPRLPDLRAAAARDVDRP